MSHLVPLLEFNHQSTPALMNVFPEVADVAPVDARCVPLQVPNANLAGGHDARYSALALLDRAVGVPGL